MYPHERSLVRKLADKPFAIIGVNSDRDLEKLRKTSVEKNITWRSFWNGKSGTRGPISKQWRVNGWPTTYLLDKDGVIRYKNLRGEALDKAIEELMAEMGEEVSLVGTDHEAEDRAAIKKAKERAAQAEKAKTDEASKAPQTSAEKAEVGAINPTIEEPASEYKRRRSTYSPAESRARVAQSLPCRRSPLRQQTPEFPPAFTDGSWSYQLGPSVGSNCK